MASYASTFTQPWSNLVIQSNNNHFHSSDLYSSNNQSREINALNIQSLVEEPSEEQYREWIEAKCEAIKSADDNNNLLDLEDRIFCVVCFVVAFAGALLIFSNKNLKSHPGTLIGIIFLM